MAIANRLEEVPSVSDTLQGYQDWDPIIVFHDIGMYGKPRLVIHRCRLIVGDGDIFGYPKHIFGTSHKYNVQEFYHNPT